MGARTPSGDDTRSPCVARAEPPPPPALRSVRVQANYSDIASAALQMHRDGSGTFTFTKTKLMYQPLERVVFDRVRDVRGAIRVLAEVLPEEVAQAAGFTEGDD